MRALIRGEGVDARWWGRMRDLVGRCLEVDASVRVSASEAASELVAMCDAAGCGDRATALASAASEGRRTMEENQSAMRLSRARWLAGPGGDMASARVLFERLLNEEGSFLHGEAKWKVRAELCVVLGCVEPSAMWERLLRPDFSIPIGVWQHVVEHGQYAGLYKGLPGDLELSLRAAVDRSLQDFVFAACQNVTCLLSLAGLGFIRSCVGPERF